MTERISQAPHGADSEVGRLRTVMLHRPGPELKRLTPRNNDKLLFDGIPWVHRAQEEHDAFAAELRARDVEVLYLTDLLTETLADGDARAAAIEEALRDLDLGDTMRGYLEGLLGEAAPEELTTYLTAGIRNDEVRGGFGLVTSLLAYDDFLIDPLPNLLFTRDSSVWVRDRVAITSLAMPARKRETELTELIYTRHPRFVGTPRMHGAHLEHVEGGDVLLLAPGVIAVGVGERTTPAGVERLARQCFQSDLAHTVLAVPIAQERATMHLDTICTLVDVDKMVVYPNVADSLVAYTVRPIGDAPAYERSADGDLVLDVAQAEPFLVAAAKAMGIDTLEQIDTGLDPVTAEREQWDDGNNTLALAPRVAVAYERNDETNARLEDAGIEVVRIAGSELGSGRGGPRCMSCPISREPLG
ncbi:MAG TPA: arginine deiminase [Nocardioides sp.]|uniref:arginine deiminase n=1 Tax=uncultured Nocardioides sp. TaxID=198441 RepID=UPI000ED04AB4|nr:arginine deiminase [uncultured Nocardioides sp.]HCB05825.1 arginine deiminase [Nocardioides sp.]HRI96503.1 arginine deiminase [Nocardioides sp.]HRK46283.1 arginine deiminase [Nocardioides sp.]